MMYDVLVVIVVSSDTSEMRTEGMAEVIAGNLSSSNVCECVHKSILITIFTQTNCDGNIDYVILRNCLLPRVTRMPSQTAIVDFAVNI